MDAPRCRDLRPTARLPTHRCSTSQGAPTITSVRFLAHFDPRTLEPLGLWSFAGAGRPELLYIDEDAREYAESVATTMKPAGWADAATPEDWLDFATYLTERTPYSAWWEFTDSDRSQADEFEHLRRAWAGTQASTSSSRFAAASRRIRFHRRYGKDLAEQVLGGGVRAFEADRRVSTTTSIWASTDDQRMAVVLGTGEGIVDIDRALAYGLTFQGDRDLHVVLPDEEVSITGVGSVPSARATLHRVAHLVTPVFVWAHAETDEDSGGVPSRSARPLVVPPQHEVRRLTRLDEELKVGEHDLEDRTAWIDSLVELAEADLGLDYSPRRSYRAWHSRGRQVLKVQRSAKGIRVTAGTDYSEHRTDKSMATVLDLSGPPVPDEIESIRSAITASIAERDAGTDGENLEHRLQARVAAPDGVAKLGLVGKLEREVPAMRPSQRRAYIDLLGVDSRGDIHVIETKIDSDPMLALQGLDYWVWAAEHREDLVALLRSRGHSVNDQPTIRLDYVVGTKSDENLPDLRYLAPQLDALDGAISWRVGQVRGWRDNDASLQVDWAPRRTVPPEHASSNPRFAVRLHQHLLAHHSREQALSRPPFLADSEAALPPSARSTYRRMAASGQLHRFFDHVRSSQQFAIALFGTLYGDALVAIARAIEPAITTASRIEFEYVDPADRLGESSQISRHVTQADVAIDASLGNGSRHLILIEVKLSEDDFGHCTGYEDPSNDRLEGCRRSDGFARGPGTCFKLANHNRGGERTYNLYVAADRPADIDGCPFRTSNNQPMRNVALAQAMVDAGEFDSASVVLCAHDGHTAIWRRWQEFKGVAATRDVRLADLPASSVLAELDPETAEMLRDRYALDYSADDGSRLLDAISRAQMMLQRVGSEGGVLGQVAKNIGAGRHAELTAEQRQLAQRLEALAEATRSARADLVPPLWD